MAAHRGAARWSPSTVDRCLLRTKGDHLGWLAASIALIEVDFEVHEPAELVDHIRGLEYPARRRHRSG